jgi:hypothetical protein
VKTPRFWSTRNSGLPAIALCLFVSLCLKAQDDTRFEPDHYLSYDILTVSLKRHTISLRDQFIDWNKFIVTRPINLLNPTAKRHNGQVFGINDPKLHYAAYELDYHADIKINKKVLVVNQFGDFVLDKFRPSRLLVPTLKRDMTPFIETSTIYNQELHGQEDHYLCYDIPPFSIDNQSGELKDQFQTRPFDKLVARRFCNPAAKIHKNNVFDIVHDVQENHLMCFEVDSKHIFKVVSLRNQFGIKKAIVTRDDELCVPSTKFELPTECFGSTPGDDGMCNGLCPNPSDQCLPDSSQSNCLCIPQQPGSCYDAVPDDFGVCNGYCSNPTEVCVTNFASNTCQCEPSQPVLCQDSSAHDDGTCNGLCPAGELCVPNQDYRCECKPEDTPCGVTADGQCGGLCPSDAPICTYIPGSNFCGCLS